MTGLTGILVFLCAMALLNNSVAAETLFEDRIVVPLPGRADVSRGGSGSIVELKDGSLLYALPHYPPLPFTGPYYPRAIVGRTSAGSVTEANGTKATPSGKRALLRSRTWSARRVLPAPPGPVRVKKRAPPCCTWRLNSMTNCSRPMNDVSGKGGAMGVM